MATFTGGIGSGWALKKETVYGTAVVTDRAHPLISETLTRTLNNADSSTLKGGTLLRPRSSWRRSTETGAGSVQTLMYSDGSAFLTEAMLGQIATTGAGPYIHTATLLSALPSYSMQVSAGPGSTTVKKVEGAVCTGWQLSAAVGANLTLGMDWVYETEVVATAATLAGTYNASQIAYNAVDIVVTVNSVAYCMDSVSFTGANNLKTDGYCLGTRQIRKPSRTNFADITGEFSMPLDVSEKVLYDLYAAGTVVPLVLTATQGTDTFVVNAKVRLDGTSPKVGGPDELMVTVPFTITPDSADTDAQSFSIVTTNSDPLA